MYKPQNAVERKLIEAYLEEVVYGKLLPTSTEGYTASIERGHREWDEQGRLDAILDISNVKTKGRPFTDLVDVDGWAGPIHLSVAIDEEKFIGGVRVIWEMPANEWGHEQTNWWPYPPVLRKP